jgi:hypothetical protein
VFSWSPEPTDIHPHQEFKKSFEWGKTCGSFTHIYKAEIWGSFNFSGMCCLSFRIKWARRESQFYRPSQIKIFQSLLPILPFIGLIKTLILATFLWALLWGICPAFRSSGPCWKWDGLQNHNIQIHLNCHINPLPGLLPVTPCVQQSIRQSPCTRHLSAIKT